jgi:hypothetical protein
VTPTDIDTFRDLHACSTPERWAAFVALARYMAAHPEQRLGQAVVNVLAPPPETSDAFVIKFDDGSYNQDGGFEVRLCEATRYPTREAAQEASVTLYGVESIELAGPLMQPDLFYVTDEAAFLAFDSAAAGGDK